MESSCPVLMETGRLSFDLPKRAMHLLGMRLQMEKSTGAGALPPPYKYYLEYSTECFGQLAQSFQCGV